jgi:hypothetical protein
MIDAELLRSICKELIAEKDFEKLQELLSLLCALVDDDQEEVEAKLRELSERYPSLKRTQTPDKKQSGRAEKNNPSNREGI